MSRPIRTVLYCLVLLVAITWIATRAAPLAEDPNAEERDVTTEKMDEALATLRAETTKGRHLVIVLGDSSLRWHAPLGGEETLTAMLERGSNEQVTIRVLAYDGFDAIAYYLLVDELAALRPAAVVLTANLQSFTDAWFGRALMKHPQLAAFLRPRRLPEAIMLPLELAGITDTSLVIDPWLRAIGANDVPEELNDYRAAMRKRLDALTMLTLAQDAADSLVVSAGMLLPVRGRSNFGFGAPRQGGGGGGRKGAYRFMDLYPDELTAEQSTVRVLRATVRDLTVRNVPTIVMLAPVHLQAARATGAYIQSNFPQAFRVVEEATTSGNGLFLNLAEVLPQETFFVDRYTHFTADGNRIVADRLLGVLQGRSAGGASR